MSESNTVRRSQDWDDSDVQFDLNMSFDTSQLSSHLHRKPREDYSFHNKFLPKQFSTTHSNTQHTTQNIQRDMFFYDNTNDEETEGNYFNHKINNLPSSLKDAHLKDPDPMDNYDNFNIRNTESPPKNKFFHRQDALQLPSPNHDVYDTLKAEYEHAELPRLPPPAIPNIKNEFRENDNYTNFSSILESVSKSLHIYFHTTYFIQQLSTFIAIYQMSSITTIKFLSESSRIIYIPHQLKVLLEP